MNLPSAVLATVLSALACGLAFPTTSWQPLAWVGLAPLLAALRSGGARRAAGLAVLWSVAFPYVIGDWMPRAIHVYYERPLWFGVLFYLFVVLSMMAPYVLLFTVLWRRIAHRSGPATPLLAAAAWAGCELVRARLFTGSSFFIGNPWGVLGYSQVGVDAVVQVASLVGIYGVSFAIAAANAGWLMLADAATGGVSARRDAAVSVATALAPAVFCLAFGAFVLRGASRADEDGVAVAVVQGDVESSARWRSSRYGKNLETYLVLTRDVIRELRPETVFWPESAMTFFVEREPAYRRSIASVLAPADAELFVGGPREADDGEGAYTNAYFRMAPDGAVLDRYDKQLLVPFAEYFPWGGIELLRRRFEGPRTFHAGRGAGTLASRAGTLGVAICNEAMLPEVVSRRVADGAAVLVNPSNDTWIPEPRFAELQLDIVRMRAVEQRRWLVRASTSGPSALVDPWGRVVARTGVDERATLAGTIRPRHSRTAYARLGDAPALVGLAVAVGAAFAGRRAGLGRTRGPG
jgi:apolipoprotein N-acyltransferase